MKLGLGSLIMMIGVMVLSGPTLALAEEIPEKIAFDWLETGSKSNDSASQARVAPTAFVTGSGSWICSPAGFGQTSRCRAGASSSSK